MIFTGYSAVDSGPKCSLLLTLKLNKNIKRNKIKPPKKKKFAECFTSILFRPQLHHGASQARAFGAGWRGNNVGASPFLLRLG